MIIMKKGEEATSTKYKNNDSLFSAALRLNAFVKNAVSFLKLTCKTTLVNQSS